MNIKAAPPEQVTHRPLFTYAPLPDDQSIRILTLEAGSGTDPLVGHLTTERLSSAPEYEAISYVWGTGGRQPSSTLVCDDGAGAAMLAMTRSIHDALCRVRLTSGPRRLWADQICINQENLAERSQQVRLMNAVYKGARRVLVWLGRDEHDVAADAVRMVHRLHAIFADPEAHRAFRTEHSERLARVSNKPWIPLSRLARLPWFHRIWIVQEIGTHAPATLFWGAAELDWEMLSSVFAILSQNYHHLRLRFNIGAPSIRYLHRRFVEPDVAYDHNHNRGSFVYELHRARHLKAQDPRDHVYAFLGHFSLLTGSRALRGLVADYSRPAEDVFVDVAVRGLKGCQSLIMLSACHWRGTRPNPSALLPSWVPDWLQAPVHMIGSPETPHRAAGGSSPDLRVDEARRILHVKGVHVDTIARHSWPFHGGSKPFTLYHPQTRRVDSTETHSGRSTLEALWRDICLYSSLTLSQPYPPTLDSPPSPSSSSSSFLSSALFALLQTLTNSCINADRSRDYHDIPPLEWLANGAAYLLRSSPNPDALDLSPALRALARAGDPYQWTRDATLVTRSRRFAVTARGYYVLGPDALQVGDIVVVLYGGKTPFVLRRNDGENSGGGGDGDGWLLLGECYVHGLMNGEALDAPGAVEDVFSIY